MRNLLPVNWQKRVTTRFLWFPEAIGNDWRWLETASYEEEYFKSNDSLIGYWFKLRWCAPNNACSGQEPAVESESKSVSGSCR